jgi:hypothetical protein
VNYLCTGFNNRCEFSKNLTNTNINYVAFRNKRGEHKKIYDKVSRLILVEMIEEQVGLLW